MCSFKPPSLIIFIITLGKGDPFRILLSDFSMVPADTSIFTFSPSLMESVLHITIGRPMLMAFLKKIRENDFAMIQDIPEDFNTLGAVSLDDPAPKLSPATMT